MINRQAEKMSAGFLASRPSGNPKKRSESQHSQAPRACEGRGVSFGVLRADVPFTPSLPDGVTAHKTGSGGRPARGYPVALRMFKIAAFSAVGRKAARTGIRAAIRPKGQAPLTRRHASGPVFRSVCAALPVLMALGSLMASRSIVKINGIRLNNRYINENWGLI